MTCSQSDFTQYSRGRDLLSCGPHSWPLTHNFQTVGSLRRAVAGVYLLRPGGPAAVAMRTVRMRSPVCLVPRKELPPTPGVQGAPDGRCESGPRSRLVAALGLSVVRPPGRSPLCRHCPAVSVPVFPVGPGG